MKIDLVDVYDAINESGSPDYLTIMDLEGGGQKLITFHWEKGLDRWERSFLVDCSGEIVGSPSQLF